MTLRERLRAIVESLPPNGLVSFTRSDLEDLLESEAESAAPAGRDRPDYTVSEVAERFGRSPQTVRDWISSGRLRAYRFNGREYRVTPAALEEFLEPQRNGYMDRGATRRKSTANLGAWRRVSDRAGVS